MEKIRNWKQDFYTIWAGQAVSLITSGVLQMAIIWHLASDKYNRVCDGVVNGDLGWVSTSSGFRFCNRSTC